jgi:predicted nucleic acid-binding protein
VILADTSVWIDHLRSHDPLLARLLDAGQVLGHAFVRGELACGHLQQRAPILSFLARLPQAMMADDDEVIGLIDRYRLMGKGIGYVDAHLLTATMLTPDAQLWTRDRNLSALARSLGLEADPRS